MWPKKYITTASRTPSNPTRKKDTWKVFLKQNTDLYGVFVLLSDKDGRLFTVPCTLAFEMFKTFLKFPKLRGSICLIWFSGLCVARMLSTLIFSILFHASHVTWWDLRSAGAHMEASRHGQGHACVRACACVYENNCNFKGKSLFQDCRDCSQSSAYLPLSPHCYKQLPDERLFQ